MAFSDGADADAFFSGVIHVHFVVTGGLEGYDAAFLQSVYLLFAEVDVAVDDYVRVAYGLVKRAVVFAVFVIDGDDQLGAFGAAGLFDADVAVFGVGNLGEHYFHGLPPNYMIAPLSRRSAISSSE